MSKNDYLNTSVRGGLLAGISVMGMLATDRGSVPTGAQAVY